ncbi:MAG: hypothetical protein LUD47_07220 [Clostridia bacterium]|nr:hypothetical protein [Clostridia bacterium]
MSTTAYVFIGVIGALAIATVISVVYFYLHNKKMKAKFAALKSELETRLNTPGSDPLTLTDAINSLGKPKKDEGNRAIWKWYSVAHSGGTVRIFGDYDKKGNIVSIKLEDDAQDEYKLSTGRGVYIDNDGFSPERFLMEYKPGGKKREGVIVLYNKTKKMYYISQTDDMRGTINSLLTSKSKDLLFEDLRNKDYEFLIKLVPLIGSRKKNLDELEKFVEEIYDYHAVKYGKLRK